MDYTCSEKPCDARGMGRYLVSKSKDIHDWIFDELGEIVTRSTSCVSAKEGETYKIYLDALNGESVLITIAPTENCSD